MAGKLIPVPSLIACFSTFSLSSAACSERNWLARSLSSHRTSHTGQSHARPVCAREMSENMNELRSGRSRNASGSFLQECPRYQCQLKLNYPSTDWRWATLSAEHAGARKHLGIGRRYMAALVLPIASRTIKLFTASHCDQCIGTVCLGFLHNLWLSQIRSK